ncbi:hypothetical protein IID23_02185 [Patescibacteria group bacterium]|nr:hypothetical protein [Patescibacteria group bacterium]
MKKDLFKESVIKFVRGLTYPLHFIDIDFETRSAAKIKDVGAWKYSEHETTELLIMRGSIDGGPTKRWLIGDPPPKKLFRLLKEGYIVRAHNSMFEYSIWNNVCVPKLGWPKLSICKFYCTQAIGCAMNFQPALEDMGEQMHLPITKDKEGKALIGFFSIPSNKRDQMWNEPKDNWDRFLRFDEYCDIDVKTQQGIAEFALPLKKFEHQIFLLTEKMNQRGLPIDIPMVTGAIDLIEKFIKEADKRARKITKKEVITLSQRDKVKNWLCTNGCPMPDMQKMTIERTLKKKGIPNRCREILRLRYLASKTSTAKYYKALEMTDKKGRCHDFIKYHIASTGRWGGRGLQIHNFVRPEIELNKWADYDYMAELITNREQGLIEILYGDVMNTLASAARSMIKAPEGKKFIAADYAQIEARIAFWFAGETKALLMFKRGIDIYCDMASDVFGRKITKADEYERFIGKQCILGLGFQMGAPKFKSSLYDNFDTVVDLNFAKSAVSLYRKKWYKVPALWKESNKSAINAVNNPGTYFDCANGKIKFFYDEDIDFLLCKLPSGRCLYYFEPEVHSSSSPWNEEQLVPKLTFMGYDADKRKWVRQHTYGGRLVENYTQAAARDIMCYGMLTAEQAGYYQLFTVHDESVSEVDKDFGSVKKYEELLCKLPKWAEEIPIVAEGWEGIRYRK